MKSTLSRSPAVGSDRPLDVTLRATFEHVSGRTLQLFLSLCTGGPPFTANLRFSYHTSSSTFPASVRKCTHHLQTQGFHLKPRRSALQRKTLFPSRHKSIPRCQLLTGTRSASISKSWHHVVQCYLRVLAELPLTTGTKKEIHSTQAWTWSTSTWLLAQKSSDRQSPLSTNF